MSRASRRHLPWASLAALIAALGVSSVFAAGAGAVVTRGPHGQFFGVTPRAGVSPAAVVSRAATKRNSGPNTSSDNGSLSYHGGSVLHSSVPYLVYWDPNGHIASSSRALYQRYLSDVAAAGDAGNVYAVDRQFTDGSGFAGAAQTFNPATQAINDIQPYPAQDTVNCPPARVMPAYPTCITDAQLQTELARLIAADGLPTGVGANSPIYFVVTPADVNICQDGATCADNTFCAYHSVFGDGGAYVLYSPVAMLVLGQSPKSCQSDGNSVVQNPNGDSALTDVALKYLSHEDNETITDPLGSGWWDPISRNENGDSCNSIHDNPAAFTPTLGGSASAGTLFNQLISGDHYYIQGEWSNADLTCKLQPTTSAISASFSAPAGAVPSTAVSFDPSASSSAAPYSSVTWSFGDGGSAFSAGADGPSTAQHTYAAGGTYTVSLTLVDQYGNLSTASHSITITSAPVPSFTISESPVSGTSVAFNGTGSRDATAGAPITSYAWNFGDGSRGSGARTHHVYRATGTYTVTLTVTNGLGLSASRSKQLGVDEPPAAAFSAPGRVAAGDTVAFNGAQSRDRDGSIVSYRWTFGDHHTGSGRAPRHRFARAGHYTVTLTVRDSAGLTATVSHQITVVRAPISRLAVARNSRGTFIQVSLRGPGVLSVGSSRSRVRRAGMISVRISPGRSGTAALRKHHKLTLNVKVKFVTRAGVTSTRSISVSFRG
ncbi:MAG: PKD domain-containing protein [Solirubrobacteraceae bacterium]